MLRPSLPTGSAMLPRTLVFRPFASKLIGVVVMIGVPTLRPRPYAEALANHLEEDLFR